MDFNHRHLSPALGAHWTLVFCKLLILKEWSGRKDLNLRPAGPEPTHGSRENQSKPLNRRRINEQLSTLIGLLIGLQIVSPTLGQRTSAWLPAALPQARQLLRWWAFVPLPVQTAVSGHRTDVRALGSSMSNSENDWSGGI